jgi:hypothetical protein
MRYGLKQFFNTIPVFIPSSILFLILVYNFHSSELRGNILTAPVLLESHIPCRTVPVSRENPVNKVRIISYASNSVEYSQEQTLAWLKLLRTGNVVDILPIRTGVETAEWAANRHDVRNVIRHKPVSPWNQFLEFQDGAVYARNIYVSDIPLVKQQKIDELIICLEQGEGLSTGANLSIDAVILW